MAWLFLAAAVAGCGAQGETKTSGKSAAPAVVKVTVAPVERRAVERTVEVVGSLKGWEEVRVGAKKGGRVFRVLHDMGDRVAPGAKLVELDPIDAQLAVAQGRSRYLAELAKLGITQEEAEEALQREGITEELIVGERVTERIEQTPAIVQATVAVEKSFQNYNRVRELFLRNAASKEELQNFENDYRAAKAARDNAIATARNIIATAVASKVALDVAEEALRDMTIKAPEPSTLPEGMQRSQLTYGVAKRSVAEGQILRDGDPVYELVIENPLRLWTNVPERYAAEVQEGQDVRIQVAAYPNDVFHGRVTRVNPAVDPVSRTFQVESFVPNDDGRLHPGGFAKASIVTQREDQALTVPIESVVRFAGVTKIFLADNGRAQAIEVKTGLEEVTTGGGAARSGWIEIMGPIPDGAQVVTSGQTKLAQGTPLEIRQVDPEDDSGLEKGSGSATKDESPSSSQGG
jgi:RND family efflux transporter MFP subunit